MCLAFFLDQTRQKTLVYYGLAGVLFVTAGFARAGEPHTALAISHTPRANSATTIHAAIDSNMLWAAPPRATIWVWPNCRSRKRAGRFVIKAQ